MNTTVFKDLKAITTENHLIDFHYLMEVIDAYNVGEFPEMKRLIDEYDSHKFFQDLYTFFQQQTWRSCINKYLNYVGITIQYQKLISEPIKRPLSELGRK